MTRFDIICDVIYNEFRRNCMSQFEKLILRIKNLDKELQFKEAIESEEHDE